TGLVAVEKVEEKSTVTRCFCKYPLKFIIPKKVGCSSKTDAVWIYTLSYGGGIVSGDCISVGLSVGDGCTAAMTTQASTKVYKSVGSKCSEQILEAGIGRDALLAFIPDPVTCYSTARYSQKQVFRVFPESNLVVVDWVTSGRHESGEKWDFESYKSINHIYLKDDDPLFIDSVLLDQMSGKSISDRMQDYQAIAMVIILGPKLKHIQDLLRAEVKQMMSGKFHSPTVNQRYQMTTESKHVQSKPALLASCSSFGPKGIGVVVRIAATTTESIYVFLRHNLASLEPFLGAQPYR
ncbi:urease accessory protein D, partial [Asparagus officinalis]|uniref:urease accessory protein D n=1 Tax=Asparagus officinalis TaxID=4686 RepID=UPI00098E214C